MRFWSVSLFFFFCFLFVCVCVAGSYPALVFVGYILLFRFFVLQVVGLLVGPFAGPTVFLPRPRGVFCGTKNLGVRVQHLLAKLDCTPKCASMGLPGGIAISCFLWHAACSKIILCSFRGADSYFVMFCIHAAAAGEKRAGMQALTPHPGLAPAVRSRAWQQEEQHTTRACKRATQTCVQTF